ncbi:MAG: pilus assembly protein PilM [Acidimicrobiia bacterium]
MAGRRVIGLDIGTNAVRVADVEFNDTIILRAFGQVALPLDAMREGEVLDPGAVTAAIQRLWRELGLKKGEVRVGIAGPRVIVRTVDLPAMPDADLASAIRFQAQELIPIPLDDAVLDFQVLESVPGPDAEEFAAAPPPVDSPFADPSPAPGAGEPGGGIPGLDPLPPADEPTEATPGATGANRVLVAAAHREAVARMIGAVRAAGLKVTAVDLVPLALVRALGRRVSPDGPGAEGIVSIGGGVTVIVVHEGGLPRFVRMLGTGGRSLTEAIARDLDLTLETAEALKRQGENSPPELAPRVTAALERPLGDLLEEVRGSLDYWRTQPGSARLLRVTVTGGVSLQPGVVDGLSRVLGVPVELARPRDGVEVGDIGFPPDEVSALDPYLPVPIGLALGGSPGGKRINLSGSDRGSSPDDTRKLALVICAVGLGLLLLLGLLSFQKQSQLSDAKDDLSNQQATNAELQSQIDELAEAQQDQAKIEAIQAQVTQILQTDVSWAVMLQEIARTIPDDTWLTAFQGAVTTDPAAASAAANTAAGVSGSTAAPGTATTPAPGALTGTVAFTATGLDFTSISSWITRVSAIPSYSDLWVPTASATQLGGRTVVNFTSNAALTPKAKSNRFEEFTGQDQTDTDAGGQP